MPKMKPYPDKMTASFEAGTFDAIEEVWPQPKDRTEFVRLAVAELVERMNRTRNKAERRQP